MFFSDPSESGCWVLAARPGSWYRNAFALSGFQDLRVTEVTDKREGRVSPGVYKIGLVSLSHPVAVFLPMTCSRAVRCRNRAVVQGTARPNYHRHLQVIAVSCERPFRRLHRWTWGLSPRGEIIMKEVRDGDADRYITKTSIWFYPNNYTTFLLHGGFGVCREHLGIS